MDIKTLLKPHFAKFETEFITINFQYDKNAIEQYKENEIINEKLRFIRDVIFNKIDLNALNYVDDEQEFCVYFIHDSIIMHVICKKFNLSLYNKNDLRHFLYNLIAIEGFKFLYDVTKIKIALAVAVR